jgi:hypothetical protein
MSRKNIEETLAELSAAEVPQSARRASLRAALLSAHGNRRDSLLIKYVSFTMTRIVPVSAMAALIIVLSVGMTVGNTSVAEAQELVQRSMTRAKAITPEIRERIEAQMKADMLQTLEEAYAAPDLRVMTPEEYQKESKFTISTSGPSHVVGMMSMHVGDGPMPAAGVAGEFFTHKVGDGDVIGYVGTEEVSPNEEHIISVSDGSESMERSFNVRYEGPTSVSASGSVMTAGMMVANRSGFEAPVKYLTYTSPRGSSVALGLDASDTPVFRVEEMSGADGVQGPDGFEKIRGEAIRLIKFESNEE